MRVKVRREKTVRCWLSERKNVRRRGGRWKEGNGSVRKCGELRCSPNLMCFRSLFVFFSPIRSKSRAEVRGVRRGKTVWVKILCSISLSVSGGAGACRFARMRAISHDFFSTKDTDPRMVSWNLSCKMCTKDPKTVSWNLSCRICTKDMDPKTVLSSLSFRGPEPTEIC